jgi:hypothetical protein
MANTRQRVTERLQTAKFRFRFNSRDHKITLKPGESIDLHYSKPTEEGYSYAHASLYNNGSAIEYESDSGGRDCDGPIDYHTDYSCPISRLHSHVIRGGKRYPDWLKGKTRVHDHYAQQMGY